VKAQGAALGDGIHIPALGLRLGEEAVGYLLFFDLSRRGGCWIFVSLPDRGVTYILGFPFPA
jgi:hypothetical protein